MIKSSILLTTSSNFFWKYFSSEIVHLQIKFEIPRLPNFDYVVLKNIQRQPCRDILCAKNEYMLRINKKLNNPSTASKSYWSILNWFLNNKKIPGVPSIFHTNKVMSDFKEKANLFNSFFASQFTLLSNSIVLHDINFHANTRLNVFRIIKKDTLGIIKALHPNKSHTIG